MSKAPKNGEEKATGETPVLSFPEVSVPNGEPTRRFKCLAERLVVLDRLGWPVCRATKGEIRHVHPGTDLFTICMNNPHQWELLDAPPKVAAPTRHERFRPKGS